MNKVVLIVMAGVAIAGRITTELGDYLVTDAVVTSWQDVHELPTLAAQGPTPHGERRLSPCGVLRIPRANVVMIINCQEDRWAKWL